MSGRTWVGPTGPYDFDGRPVSETLDVTGRALPGCSTEFHAKYDGKHSMSCFGGAWAYHKEGDVWRRDPPVHGEKLGDVIEHEGTVYIRPLGRGVIMEKGEDEYLDRYPSGRYRGTIRLERVE